MPELTENATDPLDAFFQHLSDAADNQLWQKLILSKYRGSEPALNKCTVRAIQLKGEPHLSFVFHYATNEITRNYSLLDAMKHLQSMLGNDFKSAHFFASDRQIQCEISKKGKVLLKVKKGAIEQTKDSLKSHAHDREKKRYVDVKRPFLQALGVTDEHQQVIAAMSRKWKQINKFVEIMSQAIAESGLTDEQSSKPLSVVDFGSGKGYLTFAIHDYLTHELKRKTEVVGVELRSSLTDLCNKIADNLQHQGLQFVCGDVKTHAPKHTDIMIALHACDIATDYAIEYGIRSQAAIIMCSPCCHKELRPQMKAPTILKPLLQFGIHMGQEAEMLTDAIRALILQAYGYETKVFEFVSLEHTSKNKMILAIKKHKTNNDKRQQIFAEISELKNYYHIQHHCLESLISGYSPS